jgi:hypothetical protein
VIDVDANESPLMNPIEVCSLPTTLNFLTNPISSCTPDAERIPNAVPIQLTDLPVAVLIADALPDKSSPIINETRGQSLSFKSVNEAKLDVLLAEYKICNGANSSSQLSDLM